MNSNCCSEGEADGGEREARTGSAHENRERAESGRGAARLSRTDRLPPSASLSSSFSSLSSLAALHFWKRLVIWSRFR